MYIVGVTGLIGSGKTQVARLYKDMGAYLIDADKLGHKLFKKSAVKKAIVEAFGNEIVGESDEIDRAKLAEIVFNDTKKLEQLDAIMEKPITQMIREKIFELQEFCFPGIIVVDAALLPKWEISKAMDVIILVESPKWQLMNRLTRQRGLSADDAENRIAAQVPLFKNFHPKTSSIVKNNGDMMELRSNAMHIWLEIKEQAKSKAGNK
jgi:dephospho-CoA kinase